MVAVRKIVRVLLVGVLMFGATFLLVRSASALDKQRLNKWSNYQVYFYDPDARNCIPRNPDNPDSPDEPIEPIITGDNATAIFSALVKAGYSNESAAAIMGSLQAESHLNPRVFEGGALAGDNFRAFENGSKTFKGGFGLAQWTSAGRVEKLQSYADSHNLPVVSLKAQIGFLIEELPGYGFSPSVLNAYTFKEAVFEIARHYEVPGAMIWIDHGDPPKHYNDRIPNSFSELDPSATAGAYGAWKTRYDFAVGFLGVEPEDIPDDDDDDDDDNDDDMDYCEEEDDDDNPDGPGPRPDEWIVYAQCDPRWGSLMYGSGGINGKEGKTICKAGCGPTSFAIIMANLGYDITPDKTADVAGKGGMYDYGIGSKHTITQYLANHYGLQYMSINPKSVSDINNALNSGYMVHIVGKGSAPFSTGGHYVAILAIDDNGDWIVGNSAGGTIGTYSPVAITAGAHAGGAVK